MIDKLIIIGLLISKCYCVCPPYNITYPCECEPDWHGNNLICGGSQYFNVTEISIRMSEWFSTESSEIEKEFNLLQFGNDNRMIKSLEENAFYDISFKRIHILNTVYIERIHENAFNSSRLTLESLWISVSREG